LEFWHREVVESPLLNPVGREPVGFSSLHARTGDPRGRCD
jgi:hypothetical protein